MAAQAQPRRRHQGALLGAYTAEAVGTFIFVFAGTAAVLSVHKLSHTTVGFTALGDIGISLSFGLALLAAVYMAAGVSGAHLNPAVTVALVVNGEFPWRQAPGYIISQFIGGIVGGLMSWFMFGGTLRQSLILGSTKPGPGVSWWQATFTEFVITAVLMVIIMATAVYKRAPGGALTAGLSIGLWIFAAIFIALPVSGGSTNPARTLGPDIAAGQFPLWWVYFLGPITGAAFGAALWKFVIARGRPEEVTGAARAADPRTAEEETRKAA